MISLDEIYTNLDNGNLINADEMAMNMYLSGYEQEKAVELLVSIAIEAGEATLALERLDLLKNIPSNLYRIFLQARVLFMNKQRGLALECLEQAIKIFDINQSSPEIQEKVYNLLGQCYRFLGYPDKAANAYFMAYNTVDNPQLKLLEYSNYLFNLHYLNISAAEYFTAHKQYNALLNNIEKLSSTKIFKHKLRIGYLSSDFRNHVVLHFTYVMLTAYNKEKFEVYCYSTGREDEYSKRLYEKVNCWRCMQGQAPKEIAQQIHSDEIDILVELSGHCSGGNLPVLAYKPAPIQICGIGYFATTGLDTVDYFLTDSYLSAKQKFFTEKLLKLQHSHFCYAHLSYNIEIQLAPCLKNRHITFGSFNNLTKVTDTVLSVWWKILQRVPNSRLLLKGELFDDDIGRELFISRMSKVGYDLSRVEMRGISQDYLREYFDMDIALDTFPYPGGGTTCDALYMGVPVISLLDGTHGGNFGGSILKNIGLEAGCTNSIDEYIDRAVDFANDYDLLDALHRGLRNMMINSPLMDKKIYMRELEEAYMNIWEDYKNSCMTTEKYSHSPDKYDDILPPHKKIRLGYLLPRLQNNAITAFIQAFFSKYDKVSYEVYVYAYDDAYDIFDKFSSSVDSWKYVNTLTNHEIASLINDDHIHILLDIGDDNCNDSLSILAYKPAPIQICGIGHTKTTELDEVDYFIGDAFTDLEDMLPDFSEKILRLEKSHLCYHPLYTDGTGVAEFGCPYIGDPCKTSSAPFQQNGYITFGCFHSFNKLNIDVLNVWGEIVRSIPQAKLYIIDKSFHDNNQKNDLIKMCQQAGIPMDRLIIECLHVHYMAEYSKVDIILDTFPDTEKKSICDALYMGVPIIAMCGVKHNSRISYSILQNIGDMDDCCASSMGEYIEKAVRLARNHSRLKYLHKSIRRKIEMSSLMDEGKYMADLEAAYAYVWQKYLNVSLPQASELYSSIAREYLKRADYDRAEWWIRKTIALGGDNVVEMYGYLAQSAIHRLDNYQAWKNINKAYALLQHEENKGVKKFQYSLYNNRGHFSKAMGNIDESIESYLSSVDLAGSFREKCQAYGNYLYALLCTLADWQVIESAHKKYNEFFSDFRIKNQQIIYHRKLSFKSRQHKKIKIGYMSPDFRQHVMFSFYYVLLSEYDKDNFEVTCYQLRDINDQYTEHLINLVDGWVNVANLSLEEFSDKIYKDEIDILVDLAGHTAYSALPVFVYRPAPVQITGLGWMETTGLAETDYFITDKFVDPVGDNYLSEEPLYLTSQFCYNAREDVPVPQDSPCWSQGYVTLGVFNNWYKINDNILEMWKRIMDAVPTVRMLIKCQLFISLSAQEVAFNRMYALGFDMDRVIFEPATNNYMNRYLSVDIALDTYPYPGGGTTCDSLYMGVPVVSLYGKRRGSRFGYSILKNAGLSELATDNLDGYVERVVALANDWELLSYLHKNIRKMLQDSPIMNVALYMKEIQDKYRRAMADIR